MIIGQSRNNTDIYAVTTTIYDTNTNIMSMTPAQLTINSYRKSSSPIWPSPSLQEALRQKKETTARSDTPMRVCRVTIEARSRVKRYLTC
jgi:hypothetical protein